jgi:hypothetical protein
LGQLVPPEFPITLLAQRKAQAQGIFADGFDFQNKTQSGKFNRSAHPAGPQLHLGILHFV